MVILARSLETSGCMFQVIGSLVSVSDFLGNWNFGYRATGNWFKRGLEASWPRYSRFRAIWATCGKAMADGSLLGGSEHFPPPGGSLSLSLSHVASTGIGRLAGGLCWSVVGKELAGSDAA